jgi:hypothetical protein
MATVPVADFSDLYYLIWDCWQRVTPAHDCARCWHRDMEEQLIRARFTVDREVWVRLTDRRRGRVDLVATHRDGRRIWLELDNRDPRGKSLNKLLTTGEHAAVLLRSRRMLIILPGGQVYWHNEG